jgi:hypothetical protein
VLQGRPTVRILLFYRELKDTWAGTILSRHFHKLQASGCAAASRSQLYVFRRFPSALKCLFLQVCCSLLTLDSPLYCETSAPFWDRGSAPDVAATAEFANGFEHHMGIGTNGCGGRDILKCLCLRYSCFSAEPTPLVVSRRLAGKDQHRGHLLCTLVVMRPPF